MPTATSVDSFRLRVSSGPYPIGAVKLVWERQEGIKTLKAAWRVNGVSDSRALSVLARELFVMALPDGAVCEFWLEAEGDDGTLHMSEVVVMDIDNKLQRDIEEMFRKGEIR